MDAQNRRTVFPLPVPRTDVDPDLVLDAVHQVASALSHQPATITVDQSDPDPLIAVTEHERTADIRLSALVDDFERAGVEPLPAAVEQAFLGWFDTRPVSDATAAAKGIATIGWSRRQAQISWRVVVPRPSGVAVDWVPTVHTTSDTTRRVRAAAMSRSQQLTVTPLPTGDVTVWVYLVNPALSTAVLSQPDLLANGAPIETLQAVFTPGRPVAVAPHVAAERLTEESNEPHMTLPLANLNEIGWM